MHENLDELKDLDVDMYIVSNDTPDEQLELYNQLTEAFGQSLPFVSDPELELIDFMGMKNGDVAYRGYGMIDKDGQVIFTTKNDHWGEQFDHTGAKIKEEYNNLK